MDNAAKKRHKRALRHARVRAHIKGTAERPRLAVFRSNKHIHLQLIDDVAGATLIGMSDTHLSAKEQENTKTERAFATGVALGKKARQKKIQHVVFDRGGFRYHGRVKAVAEGLRDAGVRI